VIDTKLNKVASSFLVDIRPRAAAWAPNGKRVYVTNEISGTVAVVDGTTHELLSSVHIDGDSGKPVGLITSPDSRRVYVANGRTNRVSVIDAQTLRETRRIAVGRRPWNLALSRDGRWLYTANGMSNDVSVVDLTLGRVVKTYKAGQRPWGIALVY
jgi:YVTN family beta-propeller protein